MVDKSISQAVRELEELRDEGFLSEAQFRREVRELLERGEEPPPRVASRAASSRAGLGDMVRHAAPKPGAGDDPTSIDPTLSIHDGTAAGPTEAPVSSLRRPAPRPFEPGRVIVSGKTPWDDKGHSRVSLASSSREDQDKDEDRPVHGQALKPLNPIQREQLARMAAQTNKVLNRQKREDLAFALSFLLPGLGHLYYGDIASGMGLALVGGACWVGVALQEWWVLYVLAPLALLSGALAHRAVQRRNRFADLRSRADQNRRPSESSLNVEKSIRQAGAKPPTRTR